MVTTLTTAPIHVPLPTGHPGSPRALCPCPHATRPLHAPCLHEHIPMKHQQPPRIPAMASPCIMAPYQRVLTHCNAPPLSSHPLRPPSAPLGPPLTHLSQWRYWQVCLPLCPCRSAVPCRLYPPHAQEGEVGNYAQRVGASAPSELIPSPVSAILTLPLVCLATVMHGAGSGQGSGNYLPFVNPLFRCHIPRCLSLCHLNYHPSTPSDIFILHLVNYYRVQPIIIWFQSIITHPSWICPNPVSLGPHLWSYMWIGVF